MSVKIVTIKKDILGANDEIAKTNRELLDGHHIYMINIKASPGAGKTSIIMQTINRLKDKVRIAVIEGDIASTIDADKINALEIPAVQINTEGGCHLDANMVAMAVEKLNLEQTDLIIIENVGNLICTADFALGEHNNVILLSVPEGDDKPHKYPLMFKEADVILVNKIDVLPHFDFEIDAFRDAVRGLNPSVDILPVSAKTGEGLDQWISYLENKINENRKR